MKTILIVLSLIAWSAPAFAQSPSPTHSIGAVPYLALVGGQTADTLSTLHAWGAGRGRLREANPLIGNHPARLIALKAGGATAIALIMRGLEQSPSRKTRMAARIIGYAGGSIGVLAAVHNERLTARLK